MTRPIEALNRIIEAAYKLANLKRFPSFRVHKAQDPLQHSLIVTLLCLIVAVKDKAKVDLGDLLPKALLHDLLEAYTSDIPAPVKHHDKNIEKAIKGVERAMLGTLLLDVPSAPRWKSWIAGAKKGIDGELVDLMDLIERCIYLEHEYRSGNRAQKGMFEGTIDQLKKPRYKRLLKKYPTARAILDSYSSHMKEGSSD